jgi:hypothetical protein
MGSEADCMLHFNGRATRGRAHLEQHALIVRGDVRLAVPLEDITSARADGGRLTIAWEGRRAELLIGPHAEKWADRITNPPSRLDKLGVKPGMPVLLVGVEDAEFVGELARRGARILKRAAAGTAELLFYQAERRAALDRLPKLVAAIAPHGGIWVLRPKGVSAITDADVRMAARHAGLVDVKVVSFSATHTAEKLVIPVAKRAGPGRRGSPALRKRGSPSSPDRT